MVIGEKDEITEECKQLWNLYKEYIISFCKFKLKDTPDYVEDCVQDVFMALLEARRSGTEIKSPKAWLTTVANNKIKMEYKNRKRESEHINEHINKIIHYKTTVEIFTLDMHDFSEISDELISEMKDSILNQLNFDEQSIIIDFYVKHMKVKDIAAKHGLSETNVKQKLFRARKKIMHLSNEEIEKHKF